MVTAVDVGHAGQADGFGLVYAGTEPSAVFRSDNGGDSWVDLAGLRALSSANTWSFPPGPHTHHVRWIEADVSVADRVFVAIEAGALVRTCDRGRISRDRVRGGPYDTHTAMTHPFAPGRIYSAAGDGQSLRLLDEAKALRVVIGVQPESTCAANWFRQESASLVKTDRIDRKRTALSQFADLHGMAAPLTSAWLPSQEYTLERSPESIGGLCLKQATAMDEFVGQPRLGISRLSP